MKFKDTWLGRKLIGTAYAVDEAGNVLALGGPPYQTISAHCGAQLAADRTQPGTSCWFCRWICRWLPHGHCNDAYLTESQNR